MSWLERKTIGSSFVLQCAITWYSFIKAWKKYEMDKNERLTLIVYLIIWIFGILADYKIWLKKILNLYKIELIFFKAIKHS